MDEQNEHGSNKRLTNETQNISEAPSMQATNHSTTPFSKLEDVLPDKSSKFNGPLDLPPFGSNKLNTKNYKKKVARNRQYNIPQGLLNVLGFPEERLVGNTGYIVKEVSRSITCSLFSDRDRKELELLCAISDGNQTSGNQIKICTKIQDVVRNAISAQNGFKNKMMRSSQFRQAGLRPKSNMNSGHHNRHNFEKRTNFLPSACSTKPNISEDIEGKPEDNKVFVVPDKEQCDTDNPFVPSLFLPPTFSSKPNISKEIDGKPKENKVFVAPDSQQYSYIDNPIVPSNFLPPSFSSEPNFSKGIELIPKDNMVVLPDSKQCSYTGNRHYNIYQDLLYVLDLKREELVENTVFIVQKVSRCIQSSLFSDRDREELKFLCDISKGNQIPRYQIKTSIRIQTIIIDAIAIKNGSQQNDGKLTI